MSNVECSYIKAGVVSIAAYMLLIYRYFIFVVITGGQGVVGSNPIVPTNKFRPCSGFS
jgi:hypothetical protein